MGFNEHKTEKKAGSKRPLSEYSLQVDIVEEFPDGCQITTKVKKTPLEKRSALEVNVVLDT